MPTYEYKCDDCGYFFEEFQSITADPLKICPKCGGSVKRIIGSGNGFLFKGSGFYITDYRSDSYQKAKQKAESPSTAATDKSKNKSGKTKAE
ncbi:MAG: FmdB family zinc ribbon protein [candidate division KSB1 bacterium]|jgi:putative FmdB family regulatory protein|nr:FmdB family zinc ribbon protein [candidate division KSB1 bacterium]